jgi:pantoate--beta-alanine ligase
MPRIITSPEEMQIVAGQLRNDRKRIAVVPTMGFLHEGHLSLIREGVRQCDVVITTVFVNPLQFGPQEDFERYPRDLTRDSALATEAGSDIIFAPSDAEMYPQRYVTYVDVESITRRLEGASRPGHFRGVTTVVLKLLNVTKPHVAIFGQKDAQQVVVIRRMIRDLNCDVELVVMPIVREADGVAMSSRNTYLTPTERNEAPVLHRALAIAEEMLEGGEFRCERIIHTMRMKIREETSGVVDYISICDADTLEEVVAWDGKQPLLVSLAIRFGKTRLLDNTLLRRTSDD